MTAAADLTNVPHRGLLSLATMLAVIMQVLDTTIANVALPSMQGNLGAAQDTINWVLTSYIVASAIVMPLTGWIADTIGRKRLFLISVAGFTLASCLCGLANGLTEMVAFRVLQGVFGASLAPLSQAVLLDINPRERHGQAMALWGAGIMVAPVLGPTLGGWLTDSFNWRWVFYINVPVGLLAFFGIAFAMPASPRHWRAFDFVGFTFLGLFVGSLQLMLDRGEQLDWFSSSEIIFEAALAAAALWCFVVHSATAEHPFIHPQIFRDRNYVAASIFTFAISVVLLATTALLPPLLQRIMGFPTVTTGLVLAPRGIGTMVAMLLVGRLLRIIDPRLIILVGLGLTAWGLWDMTGFTTDMDSWPIIYTGILMGFGLGLVFVPMSTVGFATLPPNLRTESAALFSLVRNIGSSIGISMVSVMLTRNIQINHAELGERLTAFSPGLNAAAHAVGMKTGSGQFVAVLDQITTLQATMLAYVDDFKLMMYVSIAAVPLVLLLRRPKASPQGPVILDAE
jgi:MFS transporter, DHA2 family, multidrug resistance protein